MKNLTLLAIDDDRLVLDSLSVFLPKNINFIKSTKLGEVPEEPIIHAAFVDMHLTGNLNRAEGIKAIEALISKYPHIQIVAISGDLNRELMEKALKAGASRFLAKPLNPDEVLITLSKIEAFYLLQEATNRPQLNQTQWIGHSPASEAVRRQIAQLKGEGGPILIEGDSGTGKEVCAKLLYQQEGQERPFIAINVAAIPENLFESEIFGHVRGAFTGAESTKMGLAEAANGGDLFLDEVEALSLNMQVKLLRFLESGEVRRVGTKETIKVNTRVIAASNKNLNDMVTRGEFREDLLWRLSGKKLQLPNLKSRNEDIPELANWFLSQDPYRKKEFTQEALEFMKNYSWPGNVRELKRVCEQLCITSPLPIIRQEDVLPIITPQLQSRGLSQLDLSKGLSELISEFEAEIIHEVLKRHKDIDEASRLLQTSRSNLYKKIKDLNIEWRA